MPEKGTAVSRDSDEVTVRRIMADEWRSYRDIRLASLLADPLSFGSTHSRELAFEDSLWMERVERGATSESHGIWIAMAGGRFIGTSGIFGEGPTFHLWGVWVEPSQRGKHIGSRLVDIALDWVRTNHPSGQVVLGVNPGSEAALKLYFHRGFVLTGEEEPLGHTPGETVKRMVLKGKS